MSLKQEFLQKVKKTKTCWLWNDTLHRGYGYVRNKEKWFGERRVHRIAFRIFVGTIPKGYLVLHKCDIRNCVRPSHLFIGTSKMNMQDCKNKMRHPHGETHGCSKLKARNVRYILKVGRQGTGYWYRGNVQKLANQFGVSRVAINNILTGTSWR